MAVALLSGALTMPAGAAARPVEDAARQAVASLPVGTTVEQLAPAARETTARVGATVGAVRNVEPVRSTVDAVVNSAPVRQVVRAARPVEGVAPRVTAAVNAVVERPDGAAPTTSPRPKAAGQPAVGGVDRGASKRSGDDRETVAGLQRLAALSTSFNAEPNAIAAEHARATASSTAASGDDRSDFGHPFGPGGGTSIGGPLGVALIALLGLLAGTLLIAPRLFTRLLRLSTARWGLAAFLVPIERPG